jgi:serine/threonine-protein kinase
MYGEGDVLGGKFRVIRTLGTGGMGVVYEVQHVITFHRRALKLLLIGDGEESGSMTDDETSSARLLREASAAGRIGNPHIVETFDAGILPTGETYVVMELLEGESFADLLRRRKQLSVSEAAALIGQVSAGLQAAHDAGIIHRDLKPGNLWVTQRDGRPFMKILDFGISKFDTKLTDETELTAKGAIMGTPFYMAPEQLDHHQTVDARADVYALGVILYLALTGQRPYGGTSFIDMMSRMARGDCTPLGELRPDLPPEMTSVVNRAMATKREERTPSARRLGEELAPFATSQPGAAPAATAAVHEAAPGDGSKEPTAGPVSMDATGGKGRRAGLGMTVAVAATLGFAAIGVTIAVVNRSPAHVEEAAAPASAASALPAAPSASAAATAAVAPPTAGEEPVQPQPPATATAPRPPTTSKAQPAPVAPPPKAPAPASPRRDDNLDRSNPYK